MELDGRKSAMGNQSDSGDWIVQGIGRLEGEVAQFSEGMSRMEQKLDRLQYAVIALLGIGFIALTVMLTPMFGERFGG